MIQSVCTGFVVAKRPDGTRIVSALDCRHDPIDAVPAAPPASDRRRPERPSRMDRHRARGGKG
jgi:hypothetical protein